MFWIDFEKKRMGGTACVKDIKKYGLIKASRKGGGYEEDEQY